MTIADLFTRVRVDLVDGDSTRFSDADLLAITKWVVEHTASVLVKNDLPIARRRYEFDTVADTQAYDELPSDFFTPRYLLRTDTKRPLDFVTEDDFDQIQSGSEVSAWAILDDSGTQKIYLAGTPSGVVTLRLSYLQWVDTSTYTTSTTLPWNGRLDPVIQDFVKIRAQNIDEMDASFDVSMLRDLEDKVLFALGGQAPRRIAREGWNSGGY